MADDIAAAVDDIVAAADDIVAAVDDIVAVADRAISATVAPRLAIHSKATNKLRLIGYVKSSFFFPANQARSTQIACVYLSNDLNVC